MTSDQQPSQHFVDVPDDPTFWKTHELPKHRVILPIAASPGHSWWLASSYCLALATPLLLFVYAILFRSDFNSDQAFRISFSAILLLLAFKLAGTAISLAYHGWRSSAVVTVDYAGLVDLRISTDQINFSQIEGAHLLTAGIGVVGVILEMKKPIPASRNPFKWGGSYRNALSRGRSLKISLYLLDHQHEIGKVIFELLKAHGVRTVPAATWWSTIG